MSLILQNPLSNPTHRIKFTHLNPPTSKTPKFSIIHNPFQSLQFTKYPFHKNLYLLNNHHFHIKAYESSSISFNAENDESSSKFSSFDAFLSLMESLCLISSMVISVGCVVNWVCLKQKNSGLVLLGNKVLVWLLAGAVAVGSVIRRRQWRRVCGSPTRSKPGFESGSMIERVEKLEESMRSATSIIRMLSRQLEKLGIRFRVTKKAMKDPISETAALAQKNSEATRALALQESILEKELAEVQNVLLAMQDQQQKQLELILAIAKSGKLLESKRAPSQGAGLKKKDSGNGSTQVDGQPIQAEAVKKDATSDKMNQDVEQGLKAGAGKTGSMSLESWNMFILKMQQTRLHLSRWVVDWQRESIEVETR